MACYAPVDSPPEKENDDSTPEEGEDSDITEASYSSYVYSQYDDPLTNYCNAVRGPFFDRLLFKRATEFERDVAIKQFDAAARDKDIPRILRELERWQFDFTVHGYPPTVDATGKNIVNTDRPLPSNCPDPIDISSDEDEVSHGHTKPTVSASCISKRRRVTRMPKTVPDYFHSVVYFSNVGNQNPFFQITELNFLVVSLKLYAKSARTDKRKHYIVCSHFFGSDFDAVRYLSPATKLSLDTTTTTRYCDAVWPIKPHVHIVSFEKSRDGNSGVSNVVKQWAAKRRGSGLEFRCSARKVKCLKCLRDYLYQGNGRILETERVSSPDDAIRCTREHQVTEPEGAHDILCFAPDDDEVGRLEGK